MTTVAIIGGSGLTNLKNLRITRREVIRTPYGEPSAPMVFGQLGGQEAVFLPRHGAGHTIPPHEVNYRANIWAIKQTGVDKVIAVNAVGGISPDYPGFRHAGDSRPGHRLHLWTRAYLLRQRAKKGDPRRFYLSLLRGTAPDRDPGGGAAPK